MLSYWTTPRLALRQMGPRDARAVVAYGERARDYQRPWEPERPADHWNKRVVADRLRFELQQAQSGTALVLYLTPIDRPDHVIGRIGISNIVRGIAQSCTIGYGLEPQAVGHGFMSEALERAIRICFDDLRLHRVEVAVIPRNERSLAVVRRVGLREEGVAKRFLKIAGVWEDHVRFALTSEEIT